MAEPHAPGRLQITLVVCAGPRDARELALELPAGATVADALRAAGLQAKAEPSAEPLQVGIWGRAAPLDKPLQHQDRVEVYRPLKVDPKVARRERFARQGARAAGLFARRRPGSKPGY